MNQNLFLRGNKQSTPKKENIKGRNLPICSVSMPHLNFGRYFIVQISSCQRVPFFPPIGWAFNMVATDRATRLSLNSTQPSVKCAFFVAVYFFRRYARFGSFEEPRKVESAKSKQQFSRLELDSHLPVVDTRDPLRHSGS